MDGSKSVTSKEINLTALMIKGSADSSNRVLGVILVYLQRDHEGNAIGNYSDPYAVQMKGPLTKPWLGVY